MMLIESLMCLDLLRGELVNQVSIWGWMIPKYIKKNQTTKQTNNRAILPPKKATCCAGEKNKDYYIALHVSSIYLVLIM